MKFKHPFAGAQDALGLSSIWPGLAASLPMFSDNYLLAGAGIAAAAAGGVASALPRADKDISLIDIESKEGFILKSDPIYPSEEGIHVGYTRENNEPVTIPYGFFMRHFALVGGSGVGKTTLGMYVLWQQMVKGGGFIFIDAKIDTDTKDALGYYARVTGREDELYIINVDNPSQSNTYNPLLSGDADEVASRLLNLLPSAEDNAGADFYRQTVYQALLSLVGALKRARLRFTFEDLTIMLQSGVAMQYILDRLKRIEAIETPGQPPSSERRTFEIFLDKYRKSGRNGGGEIDTAKMKEAFGGMTGRAAAFSQGKFGEVFNHYNPEVDLTDIMLNNKMLYVMLPTMGKDTAALNLGKMLMSDLRTAVYNLQGVPKAKRPWPPFIVFADEMGSYVMPGIARLFEQARSAQVALIPGFQAFGNLDVVGADFKDIIMQNTWSKSLYRSGSNTSATEASEIIGEVLKYQRTFSESESSGASSSGNKFNPQFNESGNDGEGMSYKEAREARVTPDQLSSLGIGETIIMVGPRMYHCNVPRLTTPIDDEKAGELRKPEFSFRPLRRTPKMPTGWDGLHFADRYKDFIFDTDDNTNEPVRGEENQDQESPKENRGNSEEAKNKKEEKKPEKKE